MQRLNQIEVFVLTCILKISSLWYASTCVELLRKSFPNWLVSISSYIQFCTVHFFSVARTKCLISTANHNKIALKYVPVFAKACGLVSLLL